MGNLQAFFAVLISFIVLVNCVASANFYADTFFNWGYQNTAIWGEGGNNLALVLNNVSGISF